MPRAVALASDFSVLTALVAAGAGVALVPRMALPADTRGVALHPPTRPVTRTVYALTRAGEGLLPQVRWVLEALGTAAAEVASM